MTRQLNPGRPVKDAARAVHRVDSLHLRKVSPETLTQLLDLPGLRVSHFAVETEADVATLHLFCEHTHDVALCPRCGEPTEEGYDQKERCVRHLDIWGMRTMLHFCQRRFECSLCAQPFSELVAWLEPKRRQSCAFERHIYERVLTTPRKHVASQEGLSPSTVLDIFKRQAKRQEKAMTSHKQSVRVLGVDEISLRKRHQQYALVLSDIEHRCVIALLPERTKEAFQQWIERLSPQELKAIEVVSMDMWNPYRQAVRQTLPHAQIVADRFHVMKQLTHQIDCLRRCLQRNAKQEDNQALLKALKGNRWLLVKNRSDLTWQEEADLQLLFSVSEELRQLYLLKQEFRLICDKIQDRPRAERFLKGWCWKAEATGNRYLIKFVATLRNWWEEFLNYFNEGITQGFVEGINRAIRGIIHRAFGFRVFDHFRLQVLAECGRKRGSG